MIQYKKKLKKFKKNYRIIMIHQMKNNVTKIIKLFNKKINLIF